MISRFTVWLNDVSLAEIDPEIFIDDISYMTVSRKFNTSQIAARNGVYSAKDYIAENRTTISFLARKYQTAERQSVVQRIIAWAANGGWLKTSDRPGQRMYVKCTRFPAVTSALRWTDSLAIEFTAYDYPFWEDETPQEVTLNNGRSGKLFLPGGLESNVSARITATDNLTSFTVKVGDTSIAFESLSIASGGVVNIQYDDEHHFLDAIYSNSSILDKRKATSDDDLIAKPGENTIRFTASGTASCVFSVKGVYL